MSFPFFPTLDGFHRQALRVVDGKGRYVAEGSLKEWKEFLDEDEIEWSVLYPTAGLTFGIRIGPVRSPKDITIIFRKSF